VSANARAQDNVKVPEIQRRKTALGALRQPNWGSIQIVDAHQRREERFNRMTPLI
jgi:hypothetical protein